MIILGFIGTLIILSAYLILSRKQAAKTAELEMQLQAAEQAALEAQNQQRQFLDAYK